MLLVPSKNLFSFYLRKYKKLPLFDFGLIRIERLFGLYNKQEEISFLGHSGASFSEDFVKFIGRQAGLNDDSTRTWLSIVKRRFETCILQKGFFQIPHIGQFRMSPQKEIYFIPSKSRSVLSKNFGIKTSDFIDASIVEKPYLSSPQTVVSTVGVSEKVVPAQAAAIATASISTADQVALSADKAITKGTSNYLMSSSDRIDTQSLQSKAHLEKPEKATYRAYDKAKQKKKWLGWAYALLMSLFFIACVILFIRTIQLKNRTIPSDPERLINVAPSPTNISDQTIRSEEVEEPVELTPELRYIVVGAFANPTNVAKMQKRIANLGYEAMIEKGRRLSKVAIVFDANQKEPSEMLNWARRTINSEAWFLERE